MNRNYLYTNYLYTNYLYTNYLYTNYLYTNYLYTNYLYTNYLYTNYLYRLNLKLNNINYYSNDTNIFFNNINNKCSFNYFKYKNQIKYNSYLSYNIFNSLINTISKSGKFYKIWFILNIFYKHINNLMLNINFYSRFINNLYNLLSINQISLIRINKKKKKNAKLKQKYESIIKYLKPNNRINFIYKWLKFDITCSAQLTIKKRIYSVLICLINNNLSKLSIYNIKKKLHTSLMLKFLKKKIT